MSSRPALPTAEEIGKLVPIGRVAKDTPYSADFLRQLARSGKIRAYKLHRDWLTTPDAVHDYLKSQTKRHEKALSLLQAAEKAFLAVALLVIVFSATPQARAQGLSNPPPSPSAISAALHHLEASWQQFAAFYGQEFSAVGAKTNQALLSFGQALLGKTTEEYLADSPAPRLALTKYSIRPRGLPESTATSAAVEAAPQVLGLSTSQSAPENNQAMSATQITVLVNQTMQHYLNDGRFTGPQGPPGPSGQTPGLTGPNGMVQNGNGQTTSVIGGTPIVSYIPASQGNGNYTGGSLAGFTNLSGQNLVANTENVTGNLTVQGSSLFGSATFSGSASVAGTFSAATSTFSTLTVSGPATFTGSTTIAGLTVTGFNPGLTLGSVAFQGATGLSQDNSNYFYNPTTHSLGLGTSSPTSTLLVQGSGSNNPFVIASSTGTQLLTVLPNGNVGIGMTAPAYKLTINAGTETANQAALSSTVSNVLTSNNTGPWNQCWSQTIDLCMGANTSQWVFQSFEGSSIYFNPLGNVTFFGGKVGMGNTNPQSSLSVSGSVAIGTYASTTDAGTGNLIVSGNVGIGTTSPVSTLAINGTITATSFTNGTNTAVLGGNNLTTVGAIPYVASSGVVTQNAGLTFTPATQTLTIGSAIQLNARGGASNLFLGIAPNPSGINNTGIGNSALQSLTTGNRNTSVGSGAMYGSTVAISNVAIGYLAMPGVSGQWNVAVGSLAGQAITGGSRNIAIGGNTMSLGSVTTNDNIAIGQDVMKDMIAPSHDGSSIGIGYQALYSVTSAANNLAIGALALQHVTVGGTGPGGPLGGSNNVAIGGLDLQLMTDGFENTVVGFNSAFISNGANNTIVGSAAFGFATTGSRDSCIGVSCLWTLTTGNNNVGVGNNSGWNTDSINGNNIGNTTGSNNTYLGVAAGPATATQHNYATMVGAESKGDCDNCIVLGRSNDFVGIGTTSPVGKLDVFLQSSDSTSLPLVVGKGTAGNYVTVLNNGNVGIGTTTVGSRLVIQGSGITSATAAETTYNASGTVLTTILNNGNVGIGTTTPTLGPLTMSSGAYVSAGGVWTNASDRNLKENFATISPASILEKIDQLPVTEWNYKTEGPGVSHIGPVAQDFWAAFHLGNSLTSISTIDPAGVALLGIQALDQKIEALQGSLTSNATTTGELTDRKSTRLNS